MDLGPREERRGKVRLLLELGGGLELMAIIEHLHKFSARQYLPRPRLCVCAWVR